MSFQNIVRSLLSIIIGLSFWLPLAVLHRAITKDDSGGFLRPWFDKFEGWIEG